MLLIQNQKNKYIQILWVLITSLILLDISHNKIPDYSLHCWQIDTLILKVAITIDLSVGSRRYSKNFQVRKYMIFSTISEIISFKCKLRKAKWFSLVQTRITKQVMYKKNVFRKIYFIHNIINRRVGKLNSIHNMDWNSKMLTYVL